MAGAGHDEQQAWRSPGFFPVFGRGLLYGVVGGVVIGIVYGGAFVWVWALTGAVLTWEPKGFLWLLLLPYGVLFGLIGGLLAGTSAGLLLGAVLAAWLASPGVRGLATARVAAFARWIAGLLTAAAVCLVMLNDADADGETFLFVDLLPAVIAVAYGAWTGGRLVTTTAIRTQQESEGRLPG